MRLNGVAAAFAGTDADAIIHGQDEDFAIAELALFATASASEDGVNRGLHELFVDADLQLDLSQQIDPVVTPSHTARLSALTAEPLAIHHRQPMDFDSSQGLFDGVEP